jgi:hypothetical protein
VSNLYGVVNKIRETVSRLSINLVVSVEQLDEFDSQLLRCLHDVVNDCEYHTLELDVDDTFDDNPYISLEEVFAECNIGYIGIAGNMVWLTTNRNDFSRPWPKVFFDLDSDCVKVRIQN